VITCVKTTMFGILLNTAALVYSIPYTSALPSMLSGSSSELPYSVSSSTSTFPIPYASTISTRAINNNMRRDISTADEDFELPTAIVLEWTISVPGNATDMQLMVIGYEGLQEMVQLVPGLNYGSVGPITGFSKMELSRGDIASSSLQGNAECISTPFTTPFINSTISSTIQVPIYFTSSTYTTIPLSTVQTVLYSNLSSPSTVYSSSISHFSTLPTNFSTSNNTMISLSSNSQQSFTSATQSPIGATNSKTAKWSTSVVSNSTSSLNIAKSSVSISKNGTEISSTSLVVPSAKVTHTVANSTQSLIQATSSKTEKLSKTTFTSNGETVVAYLTTSTPLPVVSTVYTTTWVTI
jgi:hypothetical protein